MEPAPPAVDEALVARVVFAFYERIRVDPLIGPIFDRHVSDWGEHLPIMVAFWTRTILHRGSYRGNPMEPHLRISGLGQEHFDRWLEHWEATVGDLVPGEAGAAFVVPARRIALSMMAVLMRSEA